MNTYDDDSYDDYGYDSDYTAASGWSKYGRRRTNDNAPGGDLNLADFFGVPSSARPGTCHYCGLNAATCDCR